MTRNRRCRRERQLERQVEQLTRTVRQLEAQVRRVRDWESALDLMLVALNAPARPKRPALKVVPVKDGGPR